MTRALSTRDIARAAVRTELAETALAVFRRVGFDHATINEVAAEAGVSRSTFLRYFKTKEDAVLGAMEAKGAELAEALRARPAREGDWTALRRTADVLVEDYRHDADNTFALARMVRTSPGLSAHRMEHLQAWKTLLAAVLAERADRGGPSLRDAAVAAAAVECIEAAADRWAEGGGTDDLPALVDEAFAALRPN